MSRDVQSAFVWHLILKGGDRLIFWLTATAAGWVTHAKNGPPGLNNCPTASHS